MKEWSCSLLEYSSLNLCIPDDWRGFLSIRCAESSFSTDVTVAGCMWSSVDPSLVEG